MLCFAKRTEILGEGIAEKVIASGAKRAAVIYFDGDPFPGTVFHSFQKRLAGHPVEILHSTYNNEQMDFRSILTKAKKFDPQTIVLIGYDPLAIAVRTSRDLGMNSEIYGIGFLLNPAARKAAGEAANGAYTLVWKAPSSEKLVSFAKNFKDATGREYAQDVFTIPPYDALYFLAQAYRDAQKGIQSSPVTSEELLKSLYGAQPFQCLSGTIQVLPDGMTTGFSDVVLLKVEKGELKEVVSQ